MKISCRLTFYVNFKPLIIKIGWELDILCYIFLNSKIWRATFVLFLVFLYFSVSFYPIWMKFFSKFRENVGLQAYYLSLVLNRSWTGLRTAVFSGLSQKNWEDQDRWSAWTGYSPVRFSVPFRSFEPDLEALCIIRCWRVSLREGSNVWRIIVCAFATPLFSFPGSAWVVRGTAI